MRCSITKSRGRLEKVFAAALLVSVVSAGAARAAMVDVYAMDNSTTGGVGVSTGIFYTVGDPLLVTAAVGDLWSAGPLPRWSNADGLIVDDLMATGADDSGEVAGTIIGDNIFGLHSQHGISLPHGTLVGSIDGTFFKIGTDSSLNTPLAPATGELLLWYWDQNNSDNLEFITASVVPLPAAFWLLGSGLLGMIGLSRRRKVAQA